MPRHSKRRELNHAQLNPAPSHKATTNMGSSDRDMRGNEDLELMSARYNASAPHARRHGTRVQSSLVPGDDIFVSSTALRKEFSIPVDVQMNTEGSIPPNAYSGNNLYFDIVLNGGRYVAYADHIILEYTLSNPDLLLPITIGPAHQLFSKIELLINGSNVADTLYPEQLYISYMADLTDETRAIFADNYGWQRQTDRDSTLNQYLLQNYDAYNSGAGITIPAGGTYVFYIEFPCVLSYMNIFLPAIGANKGPRYRFYPANNDVKMSTDLNPTKPVIQQAQFVVRGPQFMPGIQDQLIMDYQNTRTVIPCIAFDRQIINMVPVDGKETGDLTLNSITGQVAALFCILRPVSTSNENLFSPATN